MIVPFVAGTDKVDGKRVRTVHERFVFSSWRRATGKSDQELLRRIFRGARIFVDTNGTSPVVRGWAMDGDNGQEPFVFVCRPWHGTSIGEHIRDGLLQALGGEAAA